MDVFEKVIQQQQITNAALTFSVIKSINTGRATVRRRATEEASERGSA